MNKDNTAHFFLSVLWEYQDDKYAASVLTHGRVRIASQRWNIDIVSLVHKADWCMWINYFST